MRIAVALFFFLIGHVLAAQNEILLAKRWMVGGNGQIYIERIGGNQGRFIAVIEPQIGYFLNNRWAIGARIPFKFSTNEWQLGGAAFTRFYFKPTKEIKPFLELNGGHNWRVIPDVSGNVKNSYENIWLFGWRAGAAFFLNQNASLDLFLYQNGSRSTSKNPFSGASPTPLFKYEMGIGAGFQVYL